MLCMLGDWDSNPDSTVQSRMPYPWTISQYNFTDRRQSQSTVGQNPCGFDAFDRQGHKAPDIQILFSANRPIYTTLIRCQETAERRTDQ